MSGYDDIGGRARKREETRPSRHEGLPQVSKWIHLTRSGRRVQSGEVWRGPMGISGNAEYHFLETMGLCKKRQETNFGMRVHIRLENTKKS